MHIRVGVRSSFASILTTVATFVFIAACGSGERDKGRKEKTISAPQANTTIMLADTTLNVTIAGVETTFRFPPKPRASLLLLPGWNFSRTNWCDSTDFCDRAFALGFVLILPEARKSIYARTVYPETRADWREEITRRWFLESLFPHARDSFGLLREGENNFIAGISTGGRGAVVLCQEAPNLFKACAALSGDFAPLLMPKDNLLNGFLGPMKKYPERWAAESPVENAGLLKTDVYLAHGGQDKIVPVEQTRALLDALKRAGHSGKVRMEVAPQAGHDYAFWDAQTESLLGFFSEKITPAAPGS